MTTDFLLAVKCPGCGLEHEVKIERAKCLRCGHGWLPRQRLKDVRQCPCCRSVRWDQAPPKMAPPTVEPPGPLKTRRLGDLSPAELDTEIARYEGKLAGMPVTDPLHGRGTKALVAMQARRAALQKGTSSCSSSAPGASFPD